MGVHQTLGSGCAGVLVEAGVDTVLAPAGLVQWTLGITATANHLTGSEGITLVASDALAHGAVLRWVALSKPATRILNEAGVDTVAVNAGLLVSALAVALAAHGHTGNGWVAHEARRTDTDGVVALDEAGGSGAAVAGVDTLSVDAGLAVGAVIVSVTARRKGQFHWLTLGVTVRYPAFSAGTDHCAEWQAVDHCADGSDIAGGEGVTWVLTPLVQTGCIVRTVSIHIALRVRFCTNRCFLGCTGHQWVAHPAGRANALGVVVLDAAGS